VLYGLDRVRQANEIWLSEEQLGAGMDLASGLEQQGMALSSGEGGSTVNLVSCKDRAVDIVPALGIMANTSRVQASRAGMPASRPWHETAGLSLRAEALASAACCYGEYSKFNKQGEVCSSIGTGAGFLKSGSSSASAADTPAVDDGDDVTRRVDEDAETESAVETPEAASPVLGPLGRLASQRVSTSGLLTGMWEAKAALRGVDVRKALPAMAYTRMSDLMAAGSSRMQQPGVSTHAIALQGCAVSYSGATGEDDDDIEED
jgi:hypothetical protein